MSDLWVFLSTWVRELYCRATSHRWVHLPVDTEPDLIWDRVCTRCYSRDRRARES